jgi:hypothetical protein
LTSKQEEQRRDHRRCSFCYWKNRARFVICAA